MKSCLDWKLYSCLSKHAQWWRNDILVWSWSYLCVQNMSGKVAMFRLRRKSSGGFRVWLQNDIRLFSSWLPQLPVWPIQMWSQPASLSPLDVKIGLNIVGIGKVKNTQHEPGSRVALPANVMSIMTAWLLWCDVGKLTTDDPISWEKTTSSSISSLFFKFTFHIVFSAFPPFTGSLLYIHHLSFPPLIDASCICCLHLTSFPLVFLLHLFSTLWIDHVLSKSQFISAIISLLFMSDIITTKTDETKIIIFSRLSGLSPAAVASTQTATSWLYCL